MIVGGAVTGKTSILKFMTETINQLAKQEYRKKEYFYKIDKAAILGIKLNTFDDYKVKIADEFANDTEARV